MTAYAVARRGGTFNTMVLPVARSATRSAFGASHGTTSRPRTVAITIAAATAGAPAYGSSSSRHPVAMTTRNPATMLTAVFSTAEPVAATGETPARWART